MAWVQHRLPHVPAQRCRRAIRYPDDSSPTWPGRHAPPSPRAYAALPGCHRCPRGRPHQGGRTDLVAGRHRVLSDMGGQLCGAW